MQHKSREVGEFHQKCKTSRKCSNSYIHQRSGTETTQTNTSGPNLVGLAPELGWGQECITTSVESWAPKHSSHKTVASGFQKQSQCETWAKHKKAVLPESSGMQRLKLAARQTCQKALQRQGNQIAGERAESNLLLLQPADLKRRLIHSGNLRTTQNHL